MIQGIEVFREYFHDFKDQYVLIGGSACDLLFTEAGLDFRATKDLDLVLIVEALTPEFGRQFWSFISDGGYQHRSRSDGNPQYYRFDKPRSRKYPFMIELFSRTAALIEEPDSAVIPIHVGDDVSSLSAILLNEDYYQLLIDGKRIATDLVVLKPEYLIVFKVKAYLDIKDQREKAGLEPNDDVKKHLRDILRLTVLLTGNERPILPESIRADIMHFISQYELAPYDPAQLKLSITTEQFLEIMNDLFR